MTEGLQALYGADTSLTLVLTVDSLGLHATITTAHEGKDYRLRPTVARLRDSVESGEISVIQRYLDRKISPMHSLSATL